MAAGTDMMTKRLLPYIGIPALLVVYLILKITAVDSMTFIRAVLLIGFGYVAAYMDWKTRKVPNKLVLAMFAAWAVLIAAYVIFDINAAVKLLAPSLIGCASGGGLFLLLYIVSRKGVGGGDVKFVAAAGLFLTFTKLMPMLFFSSLLAAIVSAVLLLSKRATMKTAIPLVPFLYTGILITVFL
jgi:prepilin signal peptidase PulO-like enzyme (type II secretory pathway)